ncbi:MAG: helix-turn-helix transcriptional regulator [Clostridia bacterium]|nr:helix-turn-helix transcriptional regulator [Clostridia bacterium]
MTNRLIFGKRYEYNNEYFSNPLKFHFAELYQIGELFCEAGFQIEEHDQTSYEISYIVTGKGTFIVDGREYEVSENDVFINVPGQHHAIRADRGTPLRFCYLAFAFSGKQAADPELERFYRHFKSMYTVADKDMLAPFSAAFDELQTKSDFYMAMVGAYVEQIIIGAYRSFSRQSVKQKSASGVETRMGSAAYTIMRYIDTHYRDITDIRALARQLGYSYTYLAHVFKEKTDMTIGAYIIRKKMEEAKWLLRTGRMNVSQVAARLNYMSVQSFSNSFKHAVGISPAEYQNLPADEAAKY